jgi:hypothetical protein
MPSIRALVPLLLTLPLVGAPPLGAATLRMFVTSVAGTGDLSSWDDAGTASGLAAGDAICQARALDGGLPNPTAYRAWLSDANDDAYCRLHNLSGKKSANCNQAVLPDSAGPWWRTDGQPFAGTLHDLLHPWFQVLNPPRFDESGVELLSTAENWTEAWSGTGAQGTVAPETCGNWMTGASDVWGYYGLADSTSYSWSSGGTGSCSTLRRLYCFETGTGDPLPLFPASRPLAFLTSVFGYGDLGAWPLSAGSVGLEAGDKNCQLLAQEAGLRDPESFKAWLSDGSTSAPSRFVNHGPWVRPDGILVAASLAELTGRRLTSSIHVMETGAYHINASVWTGTLATGAADAATCASWHSATGTDYGLYGRATSTLGDWTELASFRACNYSQRNLYCLQDVPLLFFDDFESGDFWAWSARVPSL